MRTETQQISSGVFLVREISLNDEQFLLEVLQTWIEHLESSKPLSGSAYGRKVSYSVIYGNQRPCRARAGSQEQDPG